MVPNAAMQRSSPLSAATIQCSRANDPVRFSADPSATATTSRSSLRARASQESSDAGVASGSQPNSA
jgi:hypothetical protein